MKKAFIGAAVAGAIAVFGGTAMAQSMNWYGGPIYGGQPDLAVTAALVEAGGGPGHFSFPAALVSMLGRKTVDAEVARLDKQYGQAEVKTFLGGMTYAVDDALKRATKQGIKLPAPADLSGTKLAVVLVRAGTAPDGVFWAGYLFDHAISHQLHNEVMADIDTNVSENADATTHRILNQAMYDVAQALHVKDVKLSPFH